MKNKLLEEKYINHFKNKEEDLFKLFQTKSNFIVARKRQRKFYIWNLKKTITIARRGYLNKQNNHIKYPLDNYYGYTTKSPYSIEQKHKILAMFYQMNLTYKQIKYFINIDLHSLNNILKECDYYSHKKIKVKNKNNKYIKYLYINIDDAFLSLKLENNLVAKHRIRLLNFYTWYENKKFYNQIFVVLIFLHNTYSIKHTLEVVKSIMDIHYQPLFKQKEYELIVAGDGARFVKTICDKLKAKIILDKFHAKRKIYNFFLYKKYRKLTPKTRKKSRIKKKYYLKLIDLIKSKYSEETIKDFFKDLKSIYKTNEIDFEYLQSKKLINYLLNNYDGIDAWNQKWYTGCYTETFVRKFIKKFNGTYNRLFSKRIFIQLLKKECIVIDFSK